MKKNNNNQIKIQNTSRGFTLVETLVAMLIFTTIVIFGISALVSMTRDYRVTSEIRQSFDSMHYAMEDISRNIRLGTVFTGQCPSFSNLLTPNECPPIAGAQGTLAIGFQAWDATQSNDHEIVYLIDAGTMSLYKASGQSGSIININSGNPQFSQITPSSVKIDPIRSGFSIQNNTTSNKVPIVSMRLAGTVSYQNTTIPFDFQTAVAPRNRQ